MKKAVISIDNHFIRIGSSIYCENIVDQEFWTRYLDYFDEITVLVRCENRITGNVEKLLPVERSGVKIVEIPMFRSIGAFIKNFHEVVSIIKKELKVNTSNLLIVRVPSLLGYIVAFYARRYKKTIGLEIVSDMSHVAKNQNFYERVKLYVFNTLLKTTVKKADGVAYVTKYALQKQYPVKQEVIQSYYSSIALNREYLSSKRVAAKDRPFVFLHVSTLNSNSKGHEVFLKVIQTLKSQKRNVRGIVVGNGVYKEHYETMAQNLGVDQLVDFVGLVSDKLRLREYYINSDLLLFPSEFEGLPRTIIEAMACSLPVVASNVNGIPELLDEEMMCLPDDLDGFVAKSTELMDNEGKYLEQATKNYEVAHEYLDSELQKRRNEYFNALYHLEEKR